MFCVVIFSIANIVMAWLIVSWMGEMAVYDEKQRANLTKLIGFNGCSDSQTKVSTELVENTSVSTNAVVVQVLMSIVLVVLLARLGVWLYFLYLTYGNKKEKKEQEMSDIQGMTSPKGEVINS